MNMKNVTGLKAILLGACGLALWGDPRGGALAERSLVSGPSAPVAGGGKAVIWQEAVGAAVVDAPEAADDAAGGAYKQEEAARHGLALSAAVLRRFLAPGDLLWTPLMEVDAAPSIASEEAEEAEVPPPAHWAVGKKANRDQHGEVASTTKDEAPDEVAGTIESAHNDKSSCSASAEGCEDPQAADANGNTLQQEVGARPYDNKAYKHLGHHHALAALLRLASGHPLLWAHDEGEAGESFPADRIALGGVLELSSGDTATEGDAVDTKALNDVDQPSALVDEGGQRKDEAPGEAAGTIECVSSIEANEEDPKAVDADGNAFQQGEGARIYDHHDKSLGHSLAALLRRLGSGHSVLWAHDERKAGGSFPEDALALGDALSDTTEGNAVDAEALNGVKQTSSALVDRGGQPKDEAPDESVSTTPTHNEQSSCSASAEGCEDSHAADAIGDALQQEEGACPYDKAYKHLGHSVPALLRRLASGRAPWTHDMKAGESFARDVLPLGDTRVSGNTAEGDAVDADAFTGNQPSALVVQGGQPKDEAPDESVSTTPTHNEQSSCSSVEGREDSHTANAIGDALQQEEGACPYDKAYKHLGHSLAALLRLASGHPLLWAHDEGEAGESFLADALALGGVLELSSGDTATEGDAVNAKALNDVDQPSALVDEGGQRKDEAPGEAAGTIECVSSIEANEEDPQAADANGNAFQQEEGARIYDHHDKKLVHSLAALLRRLASGHSLLWAHDEIKASGGVDATLIAKQPTFSSHNHLLSQSKSAKTSDRQGQALAKDEDSGCAGLPILFASIGALMASALAIEKLIHKRKEFVRPSKATGRNRVMRWASVFIVALVASAPSVLGEAAARSSDEVQSNAVATGTSFNVHDGLRRLNQARRLALRGRGSAGDSDSTDAAAKYLHEVKDVAKDHATQLELLQKQYHEDPEGFVASLKSMIGSAQDMKSIANEAAREINPNFELPLSDGELDQALEGIDLGALQPDAVIEMIQPELLDEVATNTRHLVDILDGLDLEALSADGRRRLVDEEEEGHTPFDFGFGSGNDDTNSAFNFCQGPNPFHLSLTKPSLKRMLKGMVGNRRHMKTPRNLRSHSDSDSAAGKERHQRRLQENAICLPRCDPEDSMFWQCNCEALVEYATEITPYDLAVMYAQQYIETDENSDDYGNFTVNITENLNLFDAEDELPEKANRISSLASEMSSGDLTLQSCQSLLHEFHTAVSLDRSRQLSVEEVGEAVHTNIKLNLIEIVKMYDGLSGVEGPFASGGEVDGKIMDQYLAKTVCPFDDGANKCCPCTKDYLVKPLAAFTVNGDGCDSDYPAIYCRRIMDELLLPYEEKWRKEVKPASGGNPPVQCQSVSYASCATFADSFDLLYQGRNQTLYPDGNPMRKDPNQAVHPSSGDAALDYVNFPITHTFSSDAHGVKTVAGYEDAPLDGFPGDAGDYTFRDTWFLRDEENYYVSCSSTVKCGFLWLQAPSTKKFNVKCCSNTAEGSDFWRMSPYAIAYETRYGECPYALVLNSNADPKYGTSGIGQCPSPMTHEEATEFCVGYGGRLCTTDELSYDCARGVGCGYDSESIWATEYSFQYSAETACRTSQLDESSTLGMEACDNSASFLVGRSTSIGSVASLARLVNEKGPGRMPGKCCLDNPGTSALFGKDFDPSDMECQNRGDWHLGIGEDVCEAAGGTWTRSPCITLQECIADRPTNTSAAYSASFESFASQLDIADASDEDQCRNARQGLGFDQDYAFDTDVCDEFNSRMCDPFYSDLDESTDHADPTWKDITYTAIHYPDDPELDFIPLPDKPTLAVIDDDSSIAIAVKDLQISQPSLEGLQKLAKLLREKGKEFTESTCKKIPTSVSAPVIGVVPNPIYYICVALQWVYVNLLFVDEYLGLMALDGVKIALVPLTQKLPNYAKEVYNIVHDETQWMFQALDAINGNIYNQHTEVRKELQDRHEVMVNDINKETVNVANQEGCQIIVAMGGECSPSSRRLEGELSTVNFEAKWPFEEGMDIAELMKTIHERIADIHGALPPGKVKQAKLEGASYNLFQSETESEAGDSAEEEGSTRNLMHGAEMDSMQRTLDGVRVWVGTLSGEVKDAREQVKEKMDSIDQRVEGTADETKQMKEKIDAIEGKMDALLDVVLQLMETKQS